MKPIIRIFTMVYGEAFIRRYAEVTLPSLLQSGNVPALSPSYDIRFSLYTKPESLTMLKAAIIDVMSKTDASNKRLLSAFEIEPVALPDAPDQYTIETDDRIRATHNRRFQATCLLKEIAACIATDAVMIWCTADCFFGDNSIANLALVARNSRACISMLNLRVEETRFRTLLSNEKRWPIANDRLASLALESLHDGWRSTIVGGEREYGFLFGQWIQSLGSRLFGVNFRVPSVFAARFDLSDQAYFMLSGDLRDWDSTWPQKLISEQRFVCLGSTDVALCVELTPAATGSPTRYHDGDVHIRPLVNPRDYFRRGTHSEVMRNLVIAMRTDRDVTIHPPFGHQRNS